MASRPARAAVAIALVLGCGDKPPAERRPTPAMVPVMLAALPADAAIVIGVDVARARSSEAWRPYQPILRARLPSLVADVAAVCGIDPLERLDRIVVSLDATIDDPARTFAVLHGTVSQDQASKCVGDRIARAGDELAVTQEGRLTTYVARGSGDALHASWISPSTVAVAPAALDDPAPLAALLAGPRGAGDGGALAGLLERVDTAAVAWAIGVLPPAARAEIASMGYVPDGFLVSLDVASGVELTVGLRYEDDRAAESSRKLFTTALGEWRDEPPLPALPGYLSTARIEREGRLVVLELRLTLRQVEELVALLQETRLDDLIGPS